MLEFTILMPCLNEERSLAFCINEAKSFISNHNLKAEILIADNGSCDSSIEIARQNGARVISVHEKGYGSALIAGIRAAKGKYIIMGDSDGSYDFGDLKPFIDALRSGHSLVVGNRFKGGIEPRAMPLLHHLGAPALSTIARWKFRCPVRDFHCGLRAFRKDDALRLGLQCTGMEFATEIIAAFSMSGAKICEVPTVLRKDLRGKKSHLRTFRDGLRHLKFIMSV